MNARIPPAALDAVPLSARGQHCICHVCARSVEYTDNAGSGNGGATL